MLALLKTRTRSCGLVAAALACCAAAPAAAQASYQPAVGETLRLTADEASSGKAFQGSMSANGRYVALTIGSGYNTLVRDLRTGENLSLGQDARPSLSADGRLIAYYAGPLRRDACGRVMLHDRQNETTREVKIRYRAEDGIGGYEARSWALSPEGRYLVVFTRKVTGVNCALDTDDIEDDDSREYSDARVHVVDLQTGGEKTFRTRHLAMPSLTVSRGARRIAYSTSRESEHKVFTISRNGERQQHFAGRRGRLYDPTLSANGRALAFTTTAKLSPSDRNDFEDVYVKNLRTGEFSYAARGISPKPILSSSSALSADGRYVAFKALSENSTFAANFYVRDLKLGKTELVSATPDGRPAGNTGNVGLPSLSADGKLIAFGSASDQLVAGDSPGRSDEPHYDVFLRRLRS